MTVENKLEALRRICQAQRHTTNYGYTRKQLAAVQTVFSKVSGTDRVLRLALVSALLARPVTSMSNLHAGEVKAFLDEPDLIEILEYLKSL